MDLRIKTATFIGVVIGAIVAASIAHTSDMSPGVWTFFGIAVGWVARSSKWANE